MSDNVMTNNEQPTLWQRHRIPIILGVFALCLYLGSIVWMVYTGSKVG